MLSRRPLLALLAALLAACGTTQLPNAVVGPFKGDPAVAAAVSVNNSDVTVNITSQAFSVVPAAAATNQHQFGEGHYHLFLDVPPTAPGEVVPMGVSGIFHTTDSPFVIHNVTTGHHVLWVELGFSDHLPYTHLGVTDAAVSGALTRVEFDAGNGIVAQASPSPAASAAASPSSAPSAAATSSAAASTAPASGGSTTVMVVADPTNIGKFDPASLTVKVGDTVKWDFEDDNASHTATAGDGSFDSGSKAKGESFTFKFGKSGSFAYSCTIHPQMQASITVQ